MSKFSVKKKKCCKAEKKSVFGSLHVQNIVFLLKCSACVNPEYMNNVDSSGTFVYGYA